MLLRLTCLRVLSIFILVSLVLPVFADVENAERFEALDSEGVVASRDGMVVYLRVDAGVTGPITIPRLAAPLREMRWMSRDEGDGLRLTPGQDTWQISWQARAAGDVTLELRFDAPPLLLSETRSVTASADGSFFFPAHLAVTHGEHIRYEPQPYKNTVGYWTGANDLAAWSFIVEQPGRYNVAILQGCGRNQGGSTATMTFLRAGEEQADTTLGFEVQETGHFQNFRWVHLGEIELEVAAPYELIVEPDEIANAALMDIRAVHLIRLPDTQ